MVSRSASNTTTCGLSRILHWWEILRCRILWSKYLSIDFMPQVLFSLKYFIYRMISCEIGMVLPKYKPQRTK